LGTLEQNSTRGIVIVAVRSWVIGVGGAATGALFWEKQPELRLTATTAPSAAAVLRGR
jgi:hypothetical protein